jgi:acetyltransferase
MTTDTEPSTVAPGPPSELQQQWTSMMQLGDGSTLTIRPLLPDDRERERDFIQSLSERTRYLRMLTPMRYLSPHALDQFMDIEYDRRMALVATTSSGGVEKFVGIARYGATDSRDTAELGITVADEYQRRGIARRLIEELVRYAQGHGFKRFVGIVLPENHAMVVLANRLGFKSRYDAHDHLIHISRDL